MSDIKKKIQNKKADYEVYPYNTEEDRYGNEHHVYGESASYSIHVLFTPISSEVEIAEYGERVNEMLQACLFDDDISIRENDRVKIGKAFYKVVAVKPYPSYRLMQVERVV